MFFVLSAAYPSAFSLLLFSFPSKFESLHKKKELAGFCLRAFIVRAVAGLGTDWSS